MIEFEQEQRDLTIASIKVLGVGGAGGNTINSLVQEKCVGITTIVANTDLQALNISKAEHKIQLGIKSTKGLGAGANPELGKRAAEEDLSKIMDYLEDADIVFLTAGMGGGTGSGALPVIARALREKNILTIAIVTKPFGFEGKKRAAIAEQAIQTLKKEVDTLLVIPNQKLLDVVQQQVSMIDAFDLINGILNQSVRSIADIISKPGHINVDFADVRTIMKDMGLAVMGTGRATGPDRALDAAMSAISSPLLENMSIKGARGVLLNISGGTNLGLHEISIAASVIEQADPDASIILGSVIDPQLGDDVIITVIATGFDPVQQQAAVASAKIAQQEVSVQSVQQKVEQPLQMQPTVLDRSVSSSFVQSAPVAKPAEPHVVTQNIQPSQELLTQEDVLDVPTFMRQQGEQQKVDGE